MNCSYFFKLYACQISVGGARIRGQGGLKAVRRPFYIYAEGMVLLTIKKRKPVIWGIDDGYGDGKGVTGEGTGEDVTSEDTAWEVFEKTGKLLIPYYVAPYRKPKRRNPDEKIDLLSHITVIMPDGAKYIVGQGAIDQDTNGVWEAPEDKHSTDNFPIYLTTFLGIMAKGDEVSVDSLGMGLPVEYEEDEARHEQLKQLILEKAWHKCTIILADGKTILEPSVNVKNLIIKKQAESALFDQYLDDEGEIQNKDLQKQFNIVADIGARTYNIFALRGLTPVDDMIFQTDDGMYVPYELIRKQLEELRGAPLNNIQVPSIIRSGKYLNASNEEVDISTKIVAPQYRAHASKCANILKTTGRNWMGQAHRIIWVGGGPEQLKEYILQFTANIKAEQIFAGRFSNANGQRKIAARYLKFLEKKEKAAIKVKIGSAESEIAASSEE
jgi:plasmid segregation protein ParM